MGNPWPVLSGERGEYDVAAGNLTGAQSLLQTMAGAANSGYQIPEQVWGGPTGTGGFTFGQPGNSSTPLMWAMAQYARLAIDISAGSNADTPAVVTSCLQKSSCPVSGPSLHGHRPGPGGLSSGRYGCPGGAGCSPGGGGAGRSPGRGGGGTGGGVPGQISRTGHGAWSTTKRTSLPRLLDPGLAIARHDEHGGAADGGGDLVLAPSVQLQMVGVTAKLGLRPVEQFVRGLPGLREQPLRRVSPPRPSRPLNAPCAVSAVALSTTASSVIPASGGASERAASTHACHVSSATQITTDMPSLPPPARVACWNPRRSRTCVTNAIDISLT